MTINQIMKPINKERKAFDKVLNDFVASVKNDRIKENYQAFFSAHGKHLRPSLLFLACQSVTKEEVDQDKLMTLALILELLHSASLVHDDIIDGDDERRGRATVNNIFGNKVGVLAGDTLFSYAFALATVTFDKPYNQKITNLALKMCEAELIQANGINDKDSYLEVIHGKTALFMQVACELGAMIGGAEDEWCEALSEYGIYLGMTYQIIDDFVDQDEHALVYITIKEADIYYQKAINALARLPQSNSCNSLRGLIEYVMKMKG